VSCQGEDYVIEDSAVNGSWHLVYANPGNLSSMPQLAATTAQVRGPVCNGFVTVCAAWDRVLAGGVTI
jgi:hypothetical protein